MVFPSNVLRTASGNYFHWTTSTRLYSHLLDIYLGSHKLLKTQKEKSRKLEGSHPSQDRRKIDRHRKSITELVFPGTRRSWGTTSRIGRYSASRELEISSKSHLGKRDRRCNLCCYTTRSLWIRFSHLWGACWSCQGIERIYQQCSLGMGHSFYWSFHDPEPRDDYPLRHKGV